MSSDSEILQKIGDAFGALPKPEHFTNFAHCDECLEHDELLRHRDRDTLQIDDVGNIGWQPISFCSVEGIAYYMPALARLALSEPSPVHEWYGDTLRIHLCDHSTLLAYCNDHQRAAIAELFAHLKNSRANLNPRMTSDEDMRALIDMWLCHPHECTGPDKGASR